MPTFGERLTYLTLGGIVGEDTFGFDRYLNQAFYTSEEWKRIRRIVIERDWGCDLGIADRPIVGTVIVHHMNPITKDDILARTKYLLDPEYLVCVSDATHRVITYGADATRLSGPVVRERDDTCPWKRASGGIIRTDRRRI